LQCFKFPSIFHLSSCYKRTYEFFMKHLLYPNTYNDTKPWAYIWQILSSWFHW
jgi:hypothetical protein